MGWSCQFNQSYLSSFLFLLRLVLVFLPGIAIRAFLDTVVVIQHTFDFASSVA